MKETLGQDIWQAKLFLNAKGQIRLHEDVTKSPCVQNTV